MTKKTKKTIKDQKDRKWPKNSEKDWPWARTFGSGVSDTVNPWLDLPWGDEARTRGLSCNLLLRDLLYNLLFPTLNKLGFYPYVAWKNVVELLVDLFKFVQPKVQ